MEEFAINQIIQATLQQVQKDLGQFWINATNGALREIQDIVRESIKNSSEYNLLGAHSRAFHEIGIPDIEQRMDAIINLVVENIALYSNVTGVSNVGGLLSADFQINILDLDYEDLLNSPEASFITENEVALDWLDWLLLEGTNPVVVSFGYLNKTTPYSRTGQGIMIDTGNIKKWSVPSEIAGTRNDNWLTRAVKSLENQLPSIIDKYFGRGPNG